MEDKGCRRLAAVVTSSSFEPQSLVILLLIRCGAACEVEFLAEYWSPATILKDFLCCFFFSLDVERGATGGSIGGGRSAAVGDAPLELASNTGSSTSTFGKNFSMCSYTSSGAGRGAQVSSERSLKVLPLLLTSLRERLVAVEGREEDGFGGRTGGGGGGGGANEDEDAEADDV